MGRNTTLTENRYKHEIDENNVLRVWDNEIPNETGAPFLLQPQHPDGRDWANKEEVEAWLADFIADISQVPEIIDAEIVD